MNQLITLNQLIAQKGTHWMTEKMDVDVVTSEQIEFIWNELPVYYGYRYLCTDDVEKWRYFLGRVALANRRKHKVVAGNFDPYNFEHDTTRILDENYQNQNQNNLTRNTTKNDGETYKGDIKQTQTVDGTGNSSVDNSSDNINKQNGYNRQLVSDTPQSIVNASTTGNPSDINWTYASNLTDNIIDNTTSDNGSSTTDTRYTDSTDSNLNTTDNRTIDRSGSEKVIDIGTNKDNSTRNIKERGVSNTQMWDEYIEYLQKYNYYQYLIDLYDTVFLSSYEI